MNRRQRLALSWGALGALVVVALAIGSIGADPPTPSERVRELSGQFACPQCDGQSVRTSDVGISMQIRAEIAQQVQAGRTDDQILSSLVQAYGRQYLLTPSGSGTAGLVWVLPVFFAVLAFAGLGLAFWRWRPQPAEVTDDERELVRRALDEDRR